MSNLNSTNRLTEFPPLEADGRADGKFSFSKFMFWRKDELGDGPLPVASSPAPSASIPPTRKLSVTIPPSPTPVSAPSPSSVESYNAGGVSPGNFEARNVSNVLKRLTSLMAMGGGNSTEMKKYWMPDSVSKECYECGEKFTTFRRKHHCRICGQIFCSRCCNQEIPGKVIGAMGDLRVCVYCCKIVLSYLQSTSGGAGNESSASDLKSVCEDIQNRFEPGQDSSSYRSLTRRKASACYQEERFAGSKEHSFEFAASSGAGDKPKLVWDWASLKSMWDEMLNPVSGIDWATHRHNMMKYCHSCVVGSELIDWLLAQRKITWRSQGVQIGQLLIDAGLLECVSTNEQVFVDAYALYKPVQMQSQSQPLSAVQESSGEGELSNSGASARNSGDLGPGGETRDWGQEPGWLSQITTHSKENGDAKTQSLPASNSYSVALNLSSSSVTISKPKEASSGLEPNDPKIQKKLSQNQSSTTETMTEEFLQLTLQSRTGVDSSSAAPPTGWHSPQQLTTDGELRAFQTLCNAYVGHENKLLNQLLERMELAPEWADVILPLVHKVTEIVRPDIRNADDEMDIRRYIQFKKLPGGKKSDCRLVNGLVATKNVAHRQMKNRLKDPSILLISSSIDYQRLSNRFLSLEPLVMQEGDYLRNTVARISAMKPDVVLVEKNVARLAQDFMLNAGITLVVNVKGSVMEKVGRLAQGGSWDTQLGRPQLGLCHNFYLETFSLPEGKRKTLMFFDGCASHLGCTVLLRGGSHSELVKVKKVASFLMFVAYNWRLERSFLIDSFAMPPELPNSQNSESHEEKTEFESQLLEVILSASPFISYPLPYLETEAGKVCELRKYFPSLLYWSPSPNIRSDELPSDLENNNVLPNQEFDPVVLNSKTFIAKPKIGWESRHAFTTSKITEPVCSEDVAGLLADFRRKGSRLAISSSQSRFLNSEEGGRSEASSWNTFLDNFGNSKGGKGDEELIDALDPLRHQRLSVLFCNYSPSSNSAPYFCVNPWVVNMDLYGKNDISLGMFLEHYCFRKSYVCPARECDTPMLDHIRKFVHYNGCIEIFLRELKSPILGSGQNILTWSWCTSCKTVSPIVPLSFDAWSVSFAKYLELRFYGGAYSRRGFDNNCPHSLNQDHQHFFAQHNCVAAFKYSKIHLWEISLPKCPISVKKSPKSVEQLIEDMKSSSILGHGLYSSIFDVLSSLKDSASGLKVEEILTALAEQLKTEQSAFRLKIEDIQENLTSSAFEKFSTSKEKLEGHLWKVKDSITALKCHMAETIASWNASLNNFILQRKKEEKQTKDSNSSKPTALPRLESEPSLPVIVKEFEDSVGGGQSSSDNASLDLGLEDDEGLNLGVPSVVTRRGTSPSPSQKFDSSSKELEDLNERVEKEKRSSSSAVKTLISHFISGPGVQIVQTPWPSTEHYFPAVYSNIPIAVFESESSSIVAFALGSKEYRGKLGQANNLAPNFISSVDESFATKRRSLEEFQTSGTKSEPILEPAAEEKKDGNIEMQFSSSAAKFYCRVYFADKFRQLRSSCLIEGEEFYVRSLARCVPWAASGGKSGSTFCKTTDDRFVIKQMSRFEIQSFLDFAPNYFEYMKNSLAEQKPTVLVKIMGVYRIGFKNFGSNSASKMDILVMENLFYERTITQKFDLKGSIRNRLANVTGKGGEDLVLLDENLVNMACENPMYIRPHTKTVLSLALTNDSKFLASQLVMDYSLLVGLDEKNGNLVVGIIDYIRTFTWDKKIETFVKSSGILGGQGKTPTVVSPDEYQTRFCEAMDRYFLLVPDRWLGLGLGS